MQSLLKQLLNADNVYNNTVETYKKEKRSIKEESDDRIKKAVRNKNDELVAEKNVCQSNCRTTITALLKLMMASLILD